MGRKIKITGFLLIALFSAGVLAGWLTKDAFQRESADPGGYEIRQGGYAFTNPLLECEGAKNTIGDREIKPFKTTVEDLVRKWEAGGKVFAISVYFRDLNNGPWFGVNYEVEFSPASLLKVPVMIACLREAEVRPSLLKQKIKFTGGKDENTGENFKPSQTMVPGNYYTIEELLKRTIIYSDNNANSLLLKNINAGFLAKIYADMGITLPDMAEKTEDFMTIRSYASFFRVLFNASYLNREMSEKALLYLSQVEFKEGLVGGVPSQVKVAHKFGERTLGKNGEIKQLHDCGIVYYPDSPYLLCIMTRGGSFEYLDDAIRDVSRLVFQEIDDQHRSSPHQ